MCVKTNHDVSQKMIDWLNSEEGKKELKEALMRAEKASEYFRTSILVDPYNLNKPLI